MTIYIYEDWDSAEYTGSYTKGSSGSLKVYIEGTNDFQSATAAVMAWLPSERWDLTSEYGYLLLESFGPVKRISEYCFECPANYVDPEGSGSKKDPPKLGEFKMEYDFSAATTKATFGEKNRFTSYVDPAYNDPNPNGAINYTKNDGKIKVNGIDLRIPGLKLTISYRLPRGQITAARMRGVRAKMFNRNNAVFLGWKRRELLFVGANASQAVFGLPEIRLDFETDIEVKKKFGDIPLVTKPPHDYLDVVYDTEADEAAHAVVAKPIAAYVHHFFDDTSFPSLFGFGP